MATPREQYNTDVSRAVAIDWKHLIERCALEVRAAV